MACKSYGDQSETPGDLKNALLEAFRSHKSQGGGGIRVRDLLEGKVVVDKYGGRQREFIFSADDVLEEMVASEDDLEAKYQAVAEKFFRAREAALKNTRFYLSMVGDLDAISEIRYRSSFAIVLNRRAGLATCGQLTRSCVQ